MKRRAFSVFVALALCLSLLPTVALATSLEQNLGESSTAKATGTNAASTAQPLSNPEGEPVTYAMDSISYLDANGDEQTKSIYMPLSNTENGNQVMTASPISWYVVKTDTTINGTLTIAENAEVSLILCDGATLTVTGGVKGESGAKLHIYAQSTGDSAGKMVVLGDASPSTAPNCMAVYMSSNTLEINGGEVTVTANSNDTTKEKNIYGIYVSNLTVNGGTVKVSGGNALNPNTIIGINVQNNMTVTGGKVTAIGGDVNYTTQDALGRSSIGIKVKGTMEVTGGTVTATGGTVTTTVGDSFNASVESCGIYAQNNITVSAGTVNATGGNVTVKSENDNPGGTLSTNHSSGIYLYVNPNQTSNTPYSLKVSGGKVIAASGVIDAANPVGYGINWNGNLMVSSGAVQGANDTAVKALIKNTLTVESGTIRLAEDSKIYGSISATSASSFNTLLDKDCGYFKADGTSTTQITSITGNSLSADIGDDAYILIKKSTTSTTPYLAENGTQKSCVFYTNLTDSTTDLTAGWYVVKTDTTINNTLKIEKDADVHLILCDGKTLTVNKGVEGADAKLHIYAQSTGASAGKMNVTGALTISSDKDKVAAIYMGSDSTLEVNGGVVTATSASDTDKEKEKIGVYTYYLNVNGGELNATGGKPTDKLETNETTEKENYGISVRRDMTVNGGEVNATGGAVRATADGGSQGIQILGTLTLNGGEVNATGGQVKATIPTVAETKLFSYGIYVGTRKDSEKNFHAGEIIVNGGTLNATSNTVDVDVTATDSSTEPGSTESEDSEDIVYGARSYGIYASYYEKKKDNIFVAGDITVTGGTIKAQSGKVDVSTSLDDVDKISYYGYSSGICLGSGSLEMTGGEVITTGDTAKNAGVGLSESDGIYAGQSVTIKDGSKLTATSKDSTGHDESFSYGISCYTLIVEDDAGKGTTVTATGGSSTATTHRSDSHGIDCSEMSVGGNATVTATGGSSAAATYSESDGIYCSETLSVQDNATVKATGGNASVTGNEADCVSSSFGIYFDTLDVAGGTVTVKSGDAMYTHDIEGTLTLSGGTVQSDETGAAVRAWAAYSESENTQYYVDVSGGSIKLAEGSLVRVLVSNDVTLLSLLNEGYAYQNAEGAFVALNGQVELDNVIVKPCTTHSAAYGTCSYCGKNLGSAPSGGGGGGGGGSAPSTPSTSITVPVTSDTASVEVKADVSKDGTATVEVSDKQIEEVATNGSGTVTVDVSGVKNVESVQVPSHVVETTNQAEETGLTVSMPTGSVALDETALNSVSTGEDVTVSVKRVPATDLNEAQQAAVGDMANIGIVVDVDVFVGSEKQSSFNGGKLTISVPYTPKKNEDPSKMTVWYIKDDGTIQPMGGHYDAEKKCFVFETTHLSRYVIVSVEDMPTFTDVPNDAYYSDAVAWAVLNGITTGMTETTFGPDLSCTRAQIVTFLWRAAGQPEVTGNNPFSDVNESDYFYQAVLWAVENKITTGTTETTFSPEDTCTRAQAAAFIYRNEQANGGGFTDAWAFQLPFTDVPDWCYEAVAWCYMNGVTQGTSETTFSPNLDCSRAQIVTMLYRVSLV